ncbi:cell division protein FtsQ/DivIB [Thalassococcus sp. CAU 1522]|uniref:Cell division protein FtsQ n=1 Tax=Thalassococcus arenae TaxID=2851652 RepID=A0ABS6N936_9RHOB|nr:cell division protein FtsQ/DivIB [Thalassococcus arenae]MBV2360526.1 cell division protein FtsQ/DivIB [Thalassococcus arenae]
MRQIGDIQKIGPRFDAQAAEADKITRSDPAPSRLAYRIERLMLTPFFRFSLRVLLPCALTFGLGSLWFAQPQNRAAFLSMVEDVRAEVESRPEFQVKMMAVDGAAPDVAEMVRAVLPVDFPVSSFELDLDEMQDRVVALDPVKTATLRIRQGGVLQVDIVERVPRVLFRGETGLTLLDGTGVLVGPAVARADFPDLPVLAGEDAARAVPEALALFDAIGPLEPRLRGFERVGARRWDVVLDRGQRILLPEQGAVAALERAIAMDQAVDMLARDVVAVDLRLPQRPTVRMTGQAVQEYWRIKSIEAGGEEQE